jgi:UDP-N-acetylmuramoylalanine--D-glutamate ligase
MNIAILGFGTQGQSAYDYWNSPDNDITICDSNEDTVLPDGVNAQLGANYLHDLDRFDMLVRTPILHPRDILAANPDSPNILKKTTTVTNEFLIACPSRNIIGITGTKGKGTTSTLVARMLQNAGKRVHLGGNIGLPPLDMLHGAGALDAGVTEIQTDDWVVLELANFQLIDILHSPAIAACLMVVPEHLDWHTDMEEYLLAKQQLFRWQTESDTAIYFSSNQNSEFIASASAGKKVRLRH